MASKVVDRLQFPVGAGFAGVAFELQVVKIAGEAKPLWQVVVGLLFPASAPNKLKMIAQSRQVLSGASRTEMEYSVDVQPFSIWQRVGIEAKQRYDPVNIDQQKRLA